MARTKAYIPRAYGMKINPIILKQLLVECDINQGLIGEVTGLARTSINLVVNRGYLPVQRPGFKEVVEQFIRSRPEAIKWLKEHSLTPGDIWKSLEWETNPKLHPVGHSSRVVATKSVPAMQPGDPINLRTREVAMLSQEAQRHFKLFKNPFINDVVEDRDIYMSDEHRYIEAAMVDAAKHAGFLAVVGEVQSGKSIIRRKVVLTLQREGTVRVIFPQIIDKDRVTASSLCDAIIHDISSETPRMKLEDKSRQVYRLLLNRHRQGMRHVIIIEEAHDLNLKVIKLLKRFYELEDGYAKLLGIILIGQPELKDKLDENIHSDMREAIRRIQISEIRGLNGHIGEYLALKFKRIGAKLDDIFEPEAIDALGQRMTDIDGITGRTISSAYPGHVNNQAVKAMNLTYEMGEPKVTAAIARAI